jgi:hypothetical protein
VGSEEQMGIDRPLPSELQHGVGKVFGHTMVRTMLRKSNYSVSVPRYGTVRRLRSNRKIVPQKTNLAARRHLDTPPPL